ncbi:Hypothetical predicted protein [Mytilus galloprovincialis]|uniref:Uncharacterized protein n=1 Tax=Mytilus galloprovincialis TaxID=29158 RepID=A0A8B6G6T4_MYTGA|nr:Hypothetical predicted protein [Mytilus galloprovincialis]
MTSRQESIEDNGTTHIMLKTSTIYSSLNSIYNNKDFPLKVMKIFTSAILVAMTIAILTVTSNIYHSKSSKTSDCIKLSSLGLDVDQSKNLTCQYKKKVDLPENVLIGYFFGRWCLSCRTGGSIDIEGGGEAMPMRRTFNGFQDKRS